LDPEKNENYVSPGKIIFGTNLLNFSKIPRRYYHKVDHSFEEDFVEKFELVNIHFKSIFEAY